MAEAASKRRHTVGVDVGGTFTDVAAWDGEAVRVTKVSSTTTDQSVGVLGGADRVLPEGVVATLLHGTTVATNALLERRGAKTLLVTDESFESVLEIGRQDRPSLYDPFADRPEPLVAPELRVGLGDDRSPAGVASFAKRVAELAAAHDATAIAVCLLYSYEDPAVENMVASELARRFDGPISVSSAVVAEFREFERMSTTVINAFLGSEVRKYMSNLDRRAREKGEIDDVAVMRSSGGLTSLDHASDFPSSILLSGPAGGVVASAALGALMGHDTLISFDMGGTSTDVCRIESGRPEVTYSRAIVGYPCLMPSVAVHTVGAGGGSIAWVDDGGALRVGPRSAGAFPGPACYGRGGDEPTVTDAHLMLGRLHQEARLADELALNADLAADALGRVGDRVGLDSTQAALGVLAVVESHMVHAIRAVSVEQGTDPRDAVLMAFGGAGGLHASSLARALEMKSVVIPPFAGVFSSFGLLLSPPRADVAQTVNLDQGRFGELERSARSVLERARAELAADAGDAAEPVALTADMRYVGQSHETSVPYRLGEGWDELRRRFDSAHRRRNGFARPEDEVELVTLRAAAVGEPALSIDDLPGAGADGPPSAPRGRRTVHGPDGPVTADVWWRPSLVPGTEVAGPAIIEEAESTTYLADGETATVHPTGAVEISWLR